MDIMIIFFQDKKKTNLDTKDMQIHLHVFLLPCFYLVVWFWSSNPYYLSLFIHNFYIS